MEGLPRLPVIPVARFMHGKGSAGNLEQLFAVSKVGERLQRRNVIIVLVGMKDYEVCAGEVGNRLVADRAEWEAKDFVSRSRSPDNGCD